MAEPSAEEVQILVEFRKRVGDVLKTDEQKHDAYLLRWLRARDLDLDKSEKLLKASMVWREENGVDQVLKKPIDPFFTDEYPIIFKGTDKLEHPVAYLPVGRWDFRKLVSKGKTEEFKVYIAYCFETVIQEIQSRNVNRDPTLFPITQFTILQDWNGFPYGQLANLKSIQNMLLMVSTFEAHYPEVLYRSIFFNCPSFFSVLFALLKPILAPRTLEKIQCHGQERKKWESAMEEAIDVEQLALVLPYIKD